MLEGKTRRYIDVITNMDANIVIDRLGGDVVEAGCTTWPHWHNDWPDLKISDAAKEAVLGICIAVTNITEDMGPIQIIPAEAGTDEDQAVTCIMDKGSVLIRDIRRRHRGNINVSSKDRILPGFTLLTRVTRMLEIEPMQKSQLEMLPAESQARIPVWLRQYFTGGAGASSTCSQLA